MKTIIVSRPLAEALSLASNKPFKEEVIGREFKLYGIVKPHVSIDVKFLNSSYLQDYMKARFGDSADEMAILKEVSEVTRIIALEARKNNPTQVEWIA
jgi:hypothetical protein